MPICVSQTRAPSLPSFGDEAIGLAGRELTGEGAVGVAGDIDVVGGIDGQAGNDIGRHGGQALHERDGAVSAVVQDIAIERPWFCPPASVIGVIARHRCRRH